MLSSGGKSKNVIRTRFFNIVTSLEVFPGSGKMVEGADVPRGIYLLMGPSGSGKTIFCKAFVAAGLTGGEPCIYLSTNEACERIETSITNFLAGQASKSELRLIDAYSWRFGIAASGKPYHVVNPTNLTDVSIACEKVCRDLSNPRFVLDSISNLVFHSDPDIALKFLQLVSAKIRRIGVLGFFTLIPASHDARFLSMVQTMFDGVLEMRLDESGWEISRMLRIFSIKGAKHRTEWFVYSINDRGISLVDDKTPRCAWCGGQIPYAPHRVTLQGRKYTFHAPQCEAKFRKKLGL